MRAFLVAGLGFGDEGKGTTVDYLAGAEDAELVVFYNGGAQRAHNVVTPDGTHHTFSQFASGTFHPGCRTLHGPETLVNPLNLLTEGVMLQGKGVRDAFGRVYIDRRASLITPFHVAANRLRELVRGEEAHGTCGEGIGETASDREQGHGLVAEHLAPGSDLEMRLRDVQRRKRIELADDLAAGCSTWRAPFLDTPEWELLNNADEPIAAAQAFRSCAALVNVVSEYDLSQHETVIFEGSQGVLLDEWYGFHPHTTWSTCTFANAVRMLEGYDADITRLGVTRAYATRHGAGPFPTESLSVDVPEPHNDNDGWQGRMRFGFPDLVLMRYALDVLGGIDGLVVTNLDKFPNRLRLCVAYQRGRFICTRIEHSEIHDLSSQAQISSDLAGVEPIYQELSCDEYYERIGVPAYIKSYGPTTHDKLILQPSGEYS